MDKIEKIYADYNEIVNKIGLDKIEKRFSDLNEMYEKFIDDMEIRNDVRVDPLILMHAIMDYFTDISRLKDFHKIRLTNSYKIKAYEICWLLRRKPIQILNSDRDDLVYINEKFILSFTMSFLTRNKKNDFYLSLNETEQKSLNGFIESLYYYFKYRNCSSQSLELALLSFEAGMMIGHND